MDIRRLTVLTTPTAVLDYNFRFREVDGHLWHVLLCLLLTHTILSKNGLRLSGACSGAGELNPWVNSAKESELRQCSDPTSIHTSTKYAIIARLNV